MIIGRKNKTQQEQTLVLSLLLVFFVFWVLISWLSPGSPIGGDAFIHYKFARYAFEYPELFLHHWGKPLYTMLSAPFAQLGYFGSRLFNVLLGVASAYFTWRIVKIIGLNLRPLAIVFVLFTPIYTLLMLSAMTEVLFSFVLILAVFLFFNNKYIWAAIAISFIPFARTEGYAIILAFATALVVNKSWKPIPFLAFGTVFFSLVGSFHYHDLFWVFTQSPYAATSELYGSGDFWFYLRDGDKIFGKPLMIMMGIGSVTLIYQIVKNIFVYRKISMQSLNVLILVFGIFFGYIFLQSFLWYKGMMAVMGSHRFMATIVPLGAILALYWTKYIPLSLLRNKWPMVIASVIISIICIKATFDLYTFPYPLSKNQELAKEASDWILDNHHDTSKIWYADPIFFHFLNLDPFDKDKSDELISGGINHELATLPGDIIIWDSHFNANEGKLPLESLLGSNQFKLLEMFDPEVEFTVLGGDKYRIYIFEKTEPVHDTNLIRAIDNLPEYSDLSIKPYKVLYFNSFEGFKNNRTKYSNNICYDPVQNNIFSLQTDCQHYGLVEESMNRFTNMQRARLYAFVRVNPKRFDPESDQWKIVFTVVRDDDFIVYDIIDMTPQISFDSGWQKIQYAFDVDSKDYLPDDQVKLFWWYLGENEFLIDDVLLIKERF